MALIKCPECKKEISDTVKKCPHCGFKIKNNIDVKEIVNRVNFKEILDKLMHNKKMLYSIIGILLVIIFIIIFIAGGKDSRNAKKVISHLEENGYVCNNGSYNIGRLDENIMEDATSCIYKEDKIEHQYIIRSKEKFEVQYIFKSNEYSNTEYSFRLAPYIILEMNYIPLFKDGSKRAQYVSTSSNFVDGKATLDSICDKNDYYYEKNYEKCGDLGDYLKDVNNSIDKYKQLYDAVGIEMEIAY